MSRRAHSRSIEVSGRGVRAVVAGLLCVLLGLSAATALYPHPAATPVEYGRTGPENVSLSNTYLYWETRNSASNALTGGGTYTVAFSDQQGTRQVADCVGDCSATADKDPDPGEYQLVFDAFSRPSFLSRVTITPTAPSSWTWNGRTQTWKSTDPKVLSWGASGDVYGNVDAGDFYANEFVGPDRAGLTCAPDTYYALTNDGQLKVVSGTSVTNVGNKAPGVTRFNGLGIGAGGGRVYAYEQSANSTSVTMWYFDGLNWHPTTNTFSSSAGAYFIAGDVNPSDQAYYFGGYVGSRFYIDKFVPETGVTSRVGWVELGMSGSFNGDIAFDAAGNLFILRSSTADGTTTLFSVTAAVLAAVTNGGDRQMPTSQSFTQKLTGFVGVNGIAFNSTGGIYLGTQTIARQYHPATWEKVGGDAAVGGASPASSGDLASCNVPPTLSVKKDIKSRNYPNDQFELNIFRNGTEASTGVTSGTTLGVQGGQAGPLPVIGGVKYRVAEAMTPGSPGTLDAYTRSLACVDRKTGSTVAASLDGTVTIPSSSSVVECTFTNTAKPMGTLSIEKALTAAVPAGAATTVFTGKYACTSPDGLTVSAGTWRRTGAGKATIVTTSGPAYDQTPVGVVCRVLEDAPTAGLPNSSYAWKAPTYAPAGWYFNAIPQSQMSVAAVSSAEDTRELPNGPGALVLDGNANTYWHTEWSPTKLPPPHHVIVKLGVTPVNLGRIRLTPRQDSGSGRPKDYDVFTANPANGNCATAIYGATPVASGTLSGDYALRTADQGITLATPVSALCVKVVYKSTWGWDTADGVTSLEESVGSLAEFNAYWAEPAAAVRITTTGMVGLATVTNDVERVYGNFTVTKRLAAGSTADPAATYSGTWKCTLGAEVVTGSWGPIPAGGTWTSTLAHKIPLGASCGELTETRPTFPVAADHSYQWDGAALFSPAVAATATQPPTVTVTNTTKKLGSVAWSKVDASTGVLIGGSAWAIVGPGNPSPGTAVEDCVAASVAACTGPDQDPVAGRFLLKDLAAGGYTVTETRAPTGYIGSAGFSFTVDATSAMQVIDKGAQANTPTPAKATWHKSGPDGTVALSGSSWRLTGPGHEAGTEVTDCIAADATQCTGADRDPRGGAFAVEGLRWGAFTLVESKAPPGYIVDPTAHPFTVSATALSVDLGTFRNSPYAGPRLPFTGGLGRDHLVLIGAAVVLLAGAMQATRYGRRRLRPTP